MTQLDGTFKLRHDSETNFTANNTTLEIGELAIVYEDDLTTLVGIKPGPGDFNDLDYFGGAGIASGITFTPAGGLAATDVQAALEELDTEKATASDLATEVSDRAAADGLIAADLAAHLSDATDAHDASAISVLDTGGNFTAGDVEAVLAELAEGMGTSLPVKEEGTTVVAEPSALNFVGASVTVTDVGGVATVTITDATLTTEQVQDIVGAFVAVSGGLLTVNYDDAGNVLTFGLATEAVQDAIGALLQDNAVTDVIYDDAGNALTITLMAGAVTNAMLAGSIAQSKITNLTTDLAAKADLASPTFTGDPKAPTPSAGDNDTSIATTAFVQTEKLIGIPSDQTADYTLVIGDQAKSIGVSSATAKNVTVPPNSSVAFPVGSLVEVRQVGAGQVTIVAGSGVTLRSAGSALKTRAQYSAVSMLKVATDTWSVQGDLTT